MRTIRYRKNIHGTCLAYKIISFTKKCQLMNCSEIINVETKSYFRVFESFGKKNYLRNSQRHMLSKIAKSKFTSFFRVREQFTKEKVTLFKVLFNLKIGNKNQFSNQADH